MKRVALGFAGCGEVSVAKHLPALAEVPAIEVVAVADRNPDRLRVVERRFGVPHRYPDLAGLLEHPGLEAVALCLPPADQTAAALAVLDAGKHVWIDPPVGLALADYDAVIARASQSPAVVLMGFHMRWHRLVRQARDVIRSGRLGSIQTLRAVWNSPRHARTEPEWRRRRALGGGALVEIAMDHFDLWRFLLDTELAEIFALAVDGETEDEAAVVSGRMANGVLFSATLSERASHDLEIELGGTAGRLRVACIRFEGLEYYASETMPSSLPARAGRLAHLLKELPRALPRMHRAGDYRVSYGDEWRHFVDCVRGQARPASTLADGRQAVAAVLAAFASTTSRRPERIDPAPAAPGR